MHIDSTMPTTEMAFVQQKGDLVFSAPQSNSKCAVNTSSFSTQVQVDLERFGIAKEGFVNHDDMELAMCCLLNERRKRIAIKSFNSQVKTDLELLDPDHDGFVEYKQIEEAMALYISRNYRSRCATLFWALFAATCFIFLAATFGLVYLVVDLHKDMSSFNGMLISRATGQPLQTASTDFVVQNGVITQRAATKISRRNEMDSSDVKLLPFSATVASISSKMSLSQLASLTSLEISGQLGDGAISLKIDGFVVIPTSGLPGDKYVVFQTGAGQVVLNGTVLSPAPKNLDLVALTALAFPKSVTGDEISLFSTFHYIPLPSS